MGRTQIAGNVDDRKTNTSENGSNENRMLLCAYSNVTIWKSVYILFGISKERHKTTLLREA